MTVANRLLVVEDEPDLLEAVRSFLDSEGYSVECAANGRVALEMLRAADEGGQTPCLILLDMNMPVMGGPEVLEELARDPRLKGVPVVVFTAHAQHVPPAGARGVIVKPVEPEVLLLLVRKFCATA